MACLVVPAARGRLFRLHLVAAPGLGGAEVNPFSFQALCGLADGAEARDGCTGLPQAPGIGFELGSEAHRAFLAMPSDL